MFIGEGQGRECGLNGSCWLHGLFLFRQTENSMSQSCWAHLKWPQEMSRCLASSIGTVHAESGMGWTLHGGSVTWPVFEGGQCSAAEGGSLSSKQSILFPSSPFFPPYLLSCSLSLEGCSNLLLLFLFICFSELVVDVLRKRSPTVEFVHV